MKKRVRYAVEGASCHSFFEEDTLIRKDPSRRRPGESAIHMAGRALLALAVVLPLMTAIAAKSSAAAEQKLKPASGSTQVGESAQPKKFTMAPRWIRPGPDSTVSLKVPEAIGGGKKVSLRLSTDGAIKDLPLDIEQLQMGLAEVRIPSPMRRGIFKAELVGEGGKVLAVCPEGFNVGASEKPVIASILPSVAYARDELFDFEIIGENFKHYNADDTLVRINDVKVEFKSHLDDRESTMSAKDCVDGLPCLIVNWGTLRVFGLSLDRQNFHRPLKISVEVDQLVSGSKPLPLSCLQRYTPIAIAFAVLFLVIAVVYLFSSKKAANYRAGGRTYKTMTYLLIDNQTNTFSLSKLQLLLWTAAAIVAYSYIAASQFFIQWEWVLPKVPEGLPLLLGLSATTTALAVGAGEVRGSKGAGPVSPGIGDFLTTGGVFAPERLQFFLWTILGVIAFTGATLAQDPATVNKMAEIPSNFNPLMGASSLGYLAGKFARKAGPIVKQLLPKPPYNPPAAGASPPTIRITGENLSPRADVKLNGVSLPADEIKTAQQGAKDTEFVTELILSPKTIHPPVSGVAAVSIINPDGQNAEM